MKNTERFSNRVANYVRYRPSYPKQFIDYLYNEAGFSRTSIIADIGSGTGILTELLLERGSRVVGVEPNKEMRQAAEKLLNGYQRFVSMEGTAEETGLVDKSADFIICAQAFHWFDRDACCKEFRRVLKPGGKVVLVWNSRVIEKEGFSAAYEELLRAYANDYKEVNHNNITDEDFKLFFRNGSFEKKVFVNQQLFDLAGLKGRLLSSSYCPTEEEANFGPLMEALEKLFNQYSSGGKVVFRYDTEVYTGEV